jgi:hypothetical protein
MPHHYLTASRRLRTLGLTGGSLVVLAVAGLTATQAFAAGGAGHRTSHHAVAGSGAHLPAHHSADAGADAGVGGAAVTPNSTTSLADAVDAAVDGAGKATDYKPDIVQPGPDSRGVKLSQVAYVPTGSSAFAGVQVFYGTPDSAGLDQPTGADWTWKDVTTTTLADGSRVRTAVGDDGGIVAAERTVDGVVEMAYSYAPVGGGHSALTPDELVRVVAQLTPSGS